MSEIGRLQVAVAEALKMSDLVLTPVNVGCRWPVYRGHSSGGVELFVKVVPVELAIRTIAFLRLQSASTILPRLMLHELLPFGDGAVLCLEWKDVERIDAELMTDVQGDGFLQGCVELSQELQKATDLKVNPDDDPDRQYAVIRAYAERHRLVGGLLSELVNLDSCDFSYSGHDLVVIHGDLHSKNYGFDGDRLAAVFDLDGMTRGLACEDMAYAFTERCRKSSLGGDRRRQLCRIFGRLVNQSPWPLHDWIIAVNHARLRIAYRRLVSHPDSSFVAWDIWRRDRPLRALLRILGK